MIREKIIDSPDLIKRFCRDYNVPVSTYNGYWFPKQLSTLSIHDISYAERFDEFIEEVSTFETEEEYFQYYNNVKDVTIKYIQNHHEYECFNNMTFDTEKYFNKKELYTPENDKKNFISIDLRKANYTIMNMYCPTLFKGKTWEKFLNDFGASNYIQGSKYIRQVIFGACNPKKQIQAQTAFMNRIALSLAKRGFTPYSVVTDEIIYECDSYDTYFHLINAINDIGITGVTNDTIKITKFKLYYNEMGYNKEILNSDDPYELGKVVFKCVDSDFMCQYIKYYHKEAIEERDLVFDYKGKVATFNTPMANPFT